MKFLILACILVLAHVYGMKDAFDDVSKDIISHLTHDYPDSYYPSKGLKSSLCTKNNCCTLSNSQSCDLSTLPKDQTTLVYPGGETRCIFSDSTDFSFQVVPGVSDKLLFYFQGGGACWNEASSNPKVALCTTDASPAGLSGAFDRTNPENSLREHTIVNVLYCSGDVHGGNTVRPYNDANGVPVTQKGLANAQSVLDYVQNQVAKGQLASKFSEIVIMGCSAGSIGTQLWAKKILQTLNYEKAAVVPDSYAGVFPDGSMGPLVYSFGFCTSGFLNEANQKKCENQQLELMDINDEYMAELPNISWGFIQSKTDVVQQLFYLAVGLSVRSPEAVITPSEFYNKINEIFGRYTANAENFLTYLVDGDQHCFSPSSIYFTADPISKSDDGKKTDSPLMHDWVAQFPLNSGESADTICDGNVQDLKSFPHAKSLRTKKVIEEVYYSKANNDYCSSAVYPNTYTQK